jgi:hypothetical protein
MIFKKFKSLYKAYKNIDTYEELINAKNKLAETNSLILEGQKKVNELNTEYLANKERATLACLTPEEITSLQNQKIISSAAQIIEDFNIKLAESVEAGKNYFKFTVRNPDQPDVQALRFIAKKLKNEGFKIELGNAEVPPGMYLGIPPIEINMYVSVPEPSLLTKAIDSLLEKSPQRKLK